MEARIGSIMRVVSGIQPSGHLHLGNYFGAIQQQIDLQYIIEPRNAFFFLADFHALTTVTNPDLIRQWTREGAATYLAFGLDPTKVVLFRQSDVPEVHELSWYLQCVTNMGILQRSPSYKDKVDRGLKPNVGLFNYPVLMAADILAYKGNAVPIGRDQIPHIEIAQVFVQKFNSAFKTDILVKPEAYLPDGEADGDAAKVPGTDGQKMSKSYGNTIPIFASDEELRKAVFSIKTDSKNPAKQALDPTSCIVFRLYSLVASVDEIKDLSYRYIHDRSFPGYGTAKQLLFEKLRQVFGPPRERYLELLDPGNPEIENTLMDGARLARQTAVATLIECRKAVGFGSGMWNPFKQRIS